MKQKIAKRWVRALRSGKYEQARETLRDGNSFCCLGVLCDISKQGQWDDEEIYHDSEGEDRHHGYLTNGIIDWSGMKSKYGQWSIKESCLSDLNDTGKSFSEIADIIDLHWESL